MAISKKDAKELAKMLMDAIEEQKNASPVLVAVDPDDETYKVNKIHKGEAHDRDAAEEVLNAVNLDIMTKTHDLDTYLKPPTNRDNLSVLTKISALACPKDEYMDQALQNVDNMLLAMYRSGYEDGATDMLLNLTMSGHVNAEKILTDPPYYLLK